MRCVWFFLPLLTMACGQVKFDVDQDLDMQTVPGNLLGGVLGNFVANPFKLNIDIQAEVAMHGTGPATSAGLTELSLAITPHSAPVGNFDFLSSVHLFVLGTGLTQAEVANLDTVPKGQTTLNFNLVQGVDLLPYINAGATLTATAVGTQPMQDTSFDGHVQVEVRI